MTQSLTALGPGALDRFDAVVDVRSPSEFAEDHIPGAINLPVLSDAERAEVGTIYKQESRFRARRVGAAHVARNTALHLETALRDMPKDWHPLVYCWRGGMRSGAMAHILRQVGWHTLTLEGGYKSWRRHVLARLYGEAGLGLRLVLLDGLTGTAKTAILNALPEFGVQVVDLEGLARHRGSLFGGFPGEDQPGQKLFESRLVGGLDGLDPARPVLVEAESNRIGLRVIPPVLWAAMMEAPVVEISAAMDARVGHILSAYGDFASAPERAVEVVERLRPLHPKTRIAHWQGLLAAGDLAGFVESLMQHHYDPAYQRQSTRHGRERLFGVELSGGDVRAAAAEIAARLGAR